MNTLNLQIKNEANKINQCSVKQLSYEMDYLWDEADNDVGDLDTEFDREYIKRGLKNKPLHEIIKGKTFSDMFGKNKDLITQGLGEWMITVQDNMPMPMPDDEDDEDDYWETFVPNDNYDFCAKKYGWSKIEGKNPDIILYKKTFNVDEKNKAKYLARVKYDGRVELNSRLSLDWKYDVKPLF